MYISYHFLTVFSHYYPPKVTELMQLRAEAAEEAAAGFRAACEEESPAPGLQACSANAPPGTCAS